MKRFIVLALCLLCLGAAVPAHADLTFYIYDGASNPERYEQGDIVDITAATGPLPIPNYGPFRMLRVMTTRTKAEVMTYLDRNATRRRAYYLDTSKMTSVDLTFWNTNRAMQVAEATAIGWLSRK